MARTFRDGLEKDGGIILHELSFVNMMLKIIYIMMNKIQEDVGRDRLNDGSLIYSTCGVMWSCGQEEVAELFGACSGLMLMSAAAPVRSLSVGRRMKSSRKDAKTQRRSEVLNSPLRPLRLCVRPAGSFSGQATGYLPVS
jgi:hypothetical protein